MSKGVDSKKADKSRKQTKPRSPAENGHENGGARHDGDEESNLAKPQKKRTRWWGMLVSHALSAWCVRSWEFAASLLLYSVRRESLLLPALYGKTASLRSCHTQCCYCYFSKSEM